MIFKHLATCILSTVLIFGSVQASTLEEAVKGEHRSTENKARDVYRKPVEALKFLGLKPDMTVIEVWPGGGWYTEVLAPVLRENGKLIAAQYDMNGPYRYQRGSLASFFTKAATHPKVFNKVEVVEFSFPYKLNLTKPGTADMVLTFRNVHNLVADLYGGGAYADLAFSVWYDALKPGGILGIVDHMWDDPANEDPKARNGYISKERTLALARKAGFELVAESDILRNPKDTKDYENGVWSLPPSLAVADADKAKQIAIGESDRFLLKLVKPVK